MKRHFKGFQIDQLEIKDRKLIGKIDLM